MYLMLLAAMLCALLPAEPRGTTQAEIPIEDNIFCIQPRLAELPLPAPATTTPLPDREDWYPHETLELNTILRPGSQLGLQYMDYQQEAQVVTSMGEISPTARQAIDRAPDWMRPDLENVLSQLTLAKQLLWAELVLETPHPYIDEVAFSIAHSSPQYLNSDFALPELFTENAQFIYGVAGQLGYVEVADYGTPASDPGYYSTTRYWKKDENGTLQQVEVPREIYYWYLVHPKITDEIPAYIDPSVVENNSTHNNNIAAPPTGKFWRSWLYTVAEDNYPALSDTLVDCATLFNRDGTGGDAIRTLQWWINHTLSFTSNSERPHQPVRIYRKHFGRCGEYADYSAAAARIALIPCTSILSMSTDHTWNEFWEDGWVQWEPVNGYINAPLVYENGWGKVFGTVFDIRSDGYLSSVTDRYSEGISTLNIQVVDQNDVPVDGARVILAIFETTPRVDMVGFTDNNGLVSFVVGENRDYRARAESSFGIYPAIPGTYAQLASNSVDGETYNYQFVIEADKPMPEVENLTPPADPDQDWRFALSFWSEAWYLSGRVTWDDISSLGVYPVFYKEVAEPGHVSYLVADADNYLFYTIDGIGGVFDYVASTTGAEAFFDIPAGQDYFAFLDTKHLLGNAVKVSGVLSMDHYGVAADDPHAPPLAGIRHQVWPNPSDGACELKFELPCSGRAEVGVYNLRGQKVRTLLNAELEKGSHELAWDGCDGQGNAVAPGVYVYRVGIEGKFVSGKLLKL
jgi:hypothetical protein